MFGLLFGLATLPVVLLVTYACWQIMKMEKELPEWKKDSLQILQSLKVKLQKGVNDGM